MKDKLKTRINEFKNDPRVQGIFLGGAVGIATTLITAKAIHLNLSDPENTLHIPDSLVDHIRECGMPVLITRNDGTQLSIGPS